MGRVTASEFDGLNRLTKTTDPAGLSSSYSYDLASNLTQSTDSKGGQTKYSYIKLDTYKPSQITDPLGNSEKYIYDSFGRQIKYTDKNGNSTQTSYFDSYRITQKNLPEGITVKQTNNVDAKPVSLTDGKGQTTNYIYDIRGRLTQIQTPLSSVQNYTYDLLDRQTQSTNPEGGKTDTSYTPRGQVWKTQLPDGEQSYYQYDKRGLKTLEVLPTTQIGTSIKDYTTLTKDKTLQGKLAVNAYNYDAVGNQMQSINTYGNTTKFTYDLAGNQTAVTNPNNDKTEYSYDSRNNLVQVKNALGDTSKFEYDAKSNPTKYIDGNSNVVELAYSKLDQLISRKDGLGRTQSYSYDPNGNRLTQKTNGSQIQSNTYDAENSLINQIQLLGKQTTVTKNRYDFFMRQIFNDTQVIGKVDDDKGNSSDSKKEDNNSNKDDSKSTETVKTTSSTLYRQMTFDPSSVKQLTTQNTKNSYSIYDPTSRLPIAIQETNLGTNEKLITNNEELKKGNEKKDDSKKPTTTTNSYFLYTDLLGSLVATTDTKNKVVSSQSYDPFGNVQNNEKGKTNNEKGEDDKENSNQTSFSSLNLSFQGSRTQNSLQNFGPRAYDSTTASFIQIDPVTQGQSYSPLAKQNSQVIGNNGISGVYHQDQQNLTQNQYSLTSQNPPGSRDWDGYLDSSLSGSVEFRARMADNPNLQGPAQSVSQSYNNYLENQVGNFVSTQTITEYVQHIFVPSIIDYINSPEKAQNDLLSINIAFTNICKTDTAPPYGCNSFHSQIAQNYNTSVSPNIEGFKKYQKDNTKIWYEAVQRQIQVFDEAGFKNFASGVGVELDSYLNQRIGDLVQVMVQEARAKAQQQQTDNNAWTKPANSVCTRAQDLANPVCVSKNDNSFFENVNLVFAVYAQRAANFINWADGCYVPNSKYARDDVIWFMNLDVRDTKTGECPISRLDSRSTSRPTARVGKKGRIFPNLRSFL